MRNKLIRKTAVLMAAALTLSTCFHGNTIYVSAAEATEETSTSGVQEKETATNEIITGEIPTEEVTNGETVSKEPTSEEPSTLPIPTEEPTTPPVTEQPTTEPPTTVDYEIINGVYKVKQGVLIEYLGDKKDANVTTLSIPASVTKIEKEVFIQCIYIKEVAFEEGSRLTEIGDYAFKDCSALKLITLPEGLKKIGYRAFGNCISLSEFTIPSTVTEGREIFGTKNSVTKVTFAEGMTIIPEEILQYAYSVKNVNVSLGVTTIGKHAFYHCTGLVSFTMPNTVTSIKASAFNGCTALSTVVTSTNLKSIGTNAFKKCTSLKELTLQKTVTSIGDNAFSGDTNIVLLVYANSKGKAYARKNNIKWDYTSSEKQRRATNEAIKNRYLSKISAKNKARYQLNNLKNYVPQGTCVIGKYVVVSMYYKNLKNNSILLVYNKSTGAYVKKIVLPSKDHVGSVTNVEGRLVVGLNNISTNDYLAVISYSKLNNTKNGKKIKYDYKVKLSGRADFAGYDGTIFWAGRSANISTATMEGYKVKIKNKKLTFTKKYRYIIPANTQGVIIEKGKSSKRTFTFSQSYGRLNNSSLITYSVKVNKSNTLGKAKSTKTLPPMLEGITKYGKYVYMVFESGAGLYCGDPDNTSEIQINNVCKMKSTKLSSLL